MDLDELLQKKFLLENIQTLSSFEGCALPKKFIKLKKRIDNLEVYEEDVWICTFPKSGTTWVQEMVWMIVHNFDFKRGEKYINERSPFLERSIIVGDNFNDSAIPVYLSDSITFYNNFQSPKVVKTHLPYQLLPEQIRKGHKKPKIIYVARDPRDVCVSFFHHSTCIFSYIGSFEEFCELFLGDKLIYGPYWKHVLQFWELRNEPNVLFIKYEDMKSDLSGVIQQISGFLERPLDLEQITILEKHLSFDAMKNNSAVNREQQRLKPKVPGAPDVKFMRSGQVGGFVKEMNPQLCKRFEEWIKENIKNTDYNI